MSTSAEPFDSDTAARRFRARVLKPAEGVFLFHPRAMERLLAAHLGADGYEGSIPALDYALMPRKDFLRALETENPEALAVIEGLDLPEQIILLPIPPEQRLDQAGFTRLLHQYWAQRFEAEIARTWQQLRETHGDAEQFDAAALGAQIGAAALAEVREVLTRDGVIPAGVSGVLLCRGFAALVARLRYFAPGARGFFFPAIRDWAALDRWFSAAGLELPSPRDGAPALLEHSRPDCSCGEAATALPLPGHLPYAQSDPDAAGAPQSSPAHPANLHAPGEQAAPEQRMALTLDARLIRQGCLDALRQERRRASNSWQTRLHDAVLTLTEPLLHLLLSLSLWLVQRDWFGAVGTGTATRLYLLLFRHAARMAQRAEQQGRPATAMLALARARHLFEVMGEPCARESAEVKADLERRTHQAVARLSTRLAERWTLPPELQRGLRVFIDWLGHAQTWADAPRGARLLLRDLEHILLESDAIYYRLRPLAWGWSLGRAPLRQILPFQALLKALSALDAATNHLDSGGWSAHQIERFGPTLDAIAGHLNECLQSLLEPHLHSALEQAGFNPRNHRERVAAHKLLRELLDVIRQRHHLRFTDVRDIVARNVLRLPDSSVGEFIAGDRLARFDQTAARALPGIYKPGEFYLKGLQQLSAPLFGTRRGRLVLRHLVLPLGLAFLGLKTLDVIMGLVLPPETIVTLAPAWLVASVALLINALVYTERGRRFARTLYRVSASALRLLLWDGMRRLLRWPPLARVLATRVMRALDRHLLRPLLIGWLLLLPFVALDALIESAAFRFDLSLFALAFTLGSLAHNTPLGRHWVDEASSTLGSFMRRLNQTLVLGLVQVLLELFKELTRRFQQGLHRIEELLSHHLGESGFKLVAKALLAPLWNICQALIQFYVTVLVEPQINPIKHFPLVTIAHKLMLPFLPTITGVLVQLTNSILPKLIAYPLATLTVLLLPGLAGFLVWELKENWKLYAANHPGVPATAAVHRHDLASVMIEPAVVGTHGERMRALLRRGFHSGTLPKAFERLRRALREQLRDQRPGPGRLREAYRHLAGVERALCVFADRELSYALRLRCLDPGCTLSRIDTGALRLTTNACEFSFALHTTDGSEDSPLRLRIQIELIEPELHWRLEMTGGTLKPDCWRMVAEDLRVFAGRAGVRDAQIPEQLVHSRDRSESAN